MGEKSLVGLLNERRGVLIVYQWNKGERDLGKKRRELSENWKIKCWGKIKK